MANTASAPRKLSYRGWMSAAQEEYDRLLRLLTELRPEQWGAPTDCAGWSVHDIAAHVAGAAAATASLREQVRQMRAGRRQGKQGDLVDRINSVQVEERRGRTSEQLVSELAEQSRRGVTARRRMPAPVRAMRIPFGPPLGTRPMGYLLGCIYTRDAWMHRVDLCRATQSDLDLNSAHDGAIVEDVVAEWSAMHGTAFDLKLTGPAGGHWRSGDASPANTVEMDAIEFARTVSGRAAGEGLLAQGIPF